MQPLAHHDSVVDAPSARGSHALAKAFGDHWGGGFVGITADEHVRARTLFCAILSHTTTAGLEPLLAELGLAIVAFETEHGPVRLVHELPHVRRGRGVFAFRRTDSPTILQAPHTRNDLATGLLTGAWMAYLDFRAAAWNTIKRQSSPGADLARSSRSYFTALTEAAIDVLPTPNIVQLHGYEPDRRLTPAGRRSQAIVSSGDMLPNRHTSKVARKLGRHVGPVRLYPHDVDELGATQNPVGSIVRERGNGCFTHLELARELRERLRKEHTSNLLVGACLL